MLDVGCMYVANLGLECCRNTKLSLLNVNLTLVVTNANASSRLCHMSHMKRLW